MQLQLKRLRKAAGFKTMQNIADALDVKYATYKSWETGERNFTLEQACMIADVLGCTLDELAGRDLSPRKYSDERQASLNELYSYLDDANKSAAVGAVRGIAAAQADQKTTGERPSLGSRTA